MATSDQIRSDQMEKDKNKQIHLSIVFLTKLINFQSIIYDVKKLLCKNAQQKRCKFYEVYIVSEVSATRKVKYDRKNRK